MAKPFVSRDGIDPQGVRAEVFVQTGTGTVKALVENGNNVQVQMNVDGLKHPVGGWTSKSESIYPMLVEAKEQGREIAYRIESQRKNGIDRSIPIDVLRESMDKAKENCRNLFVGIDGTLSSEAVTNPAEDPHQGGRIPATDPRNQPVVTPAPAPAGPGGFSVEQALSGLAKARQGGLPQGIVDSTAALALAVGASVEQVMSAGVDQQVNPAPRPVRQRVAAEAKPFYAHNTDGRLNLGSYMVQAAVGAQSLAADLMHDNAVEVAERHNAAVAAGEIDGDPMEPQPVNFRQAAALGSVLLSLGDRVQVETYGGGRPDRMATSHTRARSFVYDAIKNRHPVPFGQGAEAQEEWKQQVVEEAVLRFTLAAKIAYEVAESAPVTPENNTTGSATGNAAPAADADQVAASGDATGAAQAAAPAAEVTVEQTGAGAQVRQIGNATAPRPQVPVEGDDDFEAPGTELLQQFATLAQAAGFAPTPDSPVSVFLHRKFGVTSARKVNAETIKTLVEWYSQQGEAGPDKFRAHVLAEAEQATA